MAKPIRHSPLQATLNEWKPQYAKAITAEDGREIMANVTAFFDVLMEWETAERQNNAQRKDTMTC